jgi:hypothetical protein
MLGDSTPRRSEGRFYIINREATRVTVTFSDASGAPQFLQGQLADLSLRGVRIDVDGRLDPNQSIELRIEVPDESITLERTAIVRWQQPRDTKTWWTGCELNEPFERDVVERLAKAHVLNRRRDTRYPVDKPAQVRTALTNSTHDARLINYSKGGFCVVFNGPVDFPHERLMLVVQVLEKEVTIPARVMWKGQVEGGFAVGCSFSTRDGFVHVRDYAEPTSSRRRLAIPIPPATISAWIGLLMAATIVFQTSWVMHTRPQLSEAIRDGWSSWVVEPIRERFQSDRHEVPEPPVDRAG